MTDYKNAKESMPLCVIISASKIRGGAMGCTLVPLYLVLGGEGGAAAGEVMPVVFFTQASAA